MKLFDKLNDILDRPIPSKEKIEKAISNKIPVIKLNEQLTKDEEKIQRDTAFDLCNGFSRSMFNIYPYAYDVANLDENEEKWPEKYSLFIESVDILNTVASECYVIKKYYHFNPYSIIRSFGLHTTVDKYSPYLKFAQAIDNAEKYIEKFKHCWQKEFSDYMLDQLKIWFDFKEELENEKNK